MTKTLYITLIFFLNSLLITSQIQKGQDIIGEGEFYQLGSLGATAISADGNRIVLGTTRYAPDGGRFYGMVRIYDYNGVDWIQVGNEIKGTHNFNGVGHRVSISGDGNSIAVMAENSLAGPSTLSNKSDVFIYQLIDDNWLQKGQKLTEKESGDLFGNAISLSDDGSTIAIGADKRSTSATGKPYVEVYRYNFDGTDQWTQIGETLEDNEGSAFGGSVSLSNDGNILAVGAPNSNTTRIYQFNNTSLSWSLKGQELYGESGADFGYLFGTSVSLSDDGNILAVGDHTNRGNGNFAGSVRVFNYTSENQWLQKGSDIDGENPDDSSGFVISLSSDGNTIAISGYRNDDNGANSGHVRVYRYNDDWRQLVPDIDGDIEDDELGFSLSLSGDGNTVLVGAHKNDSNVTDSGLVRVFSLIRNSNIVEGFVNYNSNNDNCISKTPLQNILVTVTSNDSNISSTTNTLGYYSIEIENEGNYSVSIGELPNHFITPTIENRSFAGLGNRHVVDFCIDGTLEDDLSITILPLNEARPGFVAFHHLVYRNNGTSVVSGEITLEFDQDIQNEESINPNYTKIEGNKMTWNFSDLHPSETRTIFAAFRILPPPVVNGDDVLIYTANISSANADSNPDDNNFVLNQIVVNSFDPNDKRVTQGESIFIDEVDGYLDYMIRFQNTGTASAINVVLKDTLDPNLDWNSFQMISASHTYELKIIDGNNVEFIFENINLPDSTTDERASNGYVAFKIKPQNSVKLGDVIKGKADIFFDFNLPIVTNVVQTRIIERPKLSSPESFFVNKLKIYPIPLNNSELHIEFNTSPPKIIKTSFITLSGKEIRLQPLINRNEYTVDLSPIPSGMYFLKVVLDQNILIKKVIK